MVMRTRPSIATEEAESNLEKLTVYRRPVNKLQQNQTDHNQGVLC